MLLGLQIADNDDGGRLLVFHQGDLGDDEAVLVGVRLDEDAYHGVGPQSRQVLVGESGTLTAAIARLRLRCTLMNTTFPVALSSPTEREPV